MGTDVLQEAADCVFSVELRQCVFTNVVIGGGGEGRIACSQFFGFP